jgi:hypothetical protein
MVTKSEFDKALFEIQSQIDDLCSHTDRSIYATEECMERHLALVEEQYHLKDARAQASIVQAVI